VVALFDKPLQQVVVKLFLKKILAYTIATTLVPRKGSLSSISNRDVFILYYVLKKYHINWAEWIKITCSKS
ncbi:MAG: hypothetical protein Q8830_03510, partial [Candidatus Phytoplasma australasiaticum]|nr:hypothetical protein [Candidatus Phytoplasma australasiaticum]